MARKAKRPRLTRGAAQEKLWEWVVGQYFEYHDEKQKLGGYPAEWDGRLTSSIKFAPAISADELRTELVHQMGQAVWKADPARRRELIEGDEDDAREGEDLLGAHSSTRDAPGAHSSHRPGDSDGHDDDDEADLFHVAGVTIPRSYTVPDANVPGGFRRVVRRWATLRQAQMDALVKQKKAEESLEASRQASLDVARISAIVADPDALLWELRDGHRRRLDDEEHPYA